MTTTVLAHPKPQFEENSYVGRWSNALRVQGADVQFLTLPNVIKHRRAAVHIHWPEHLVSHPHWAGRVLKTANALAILGLLTLFRRTVIWTAHNEQPHSEAHRGLQNAVSASVRRLATGVIITTASHQELFQSRYPELRNASFHVIPLGSLALEEARAVAHNEKQTISPVPAFIQFGTIDPYKEQHKTLDYLSEFIVKGQVTLTLVGRVGEQAYVNQLRTRVDAMPGVEMIDRYVSDEELAQLVIDADASLALQGGAINSGVIPASIPLSTPVISAETAQALDHRRVLGDEWIFCLASPQDPDVWSQIINWAQAPRPKAPDDYFNWQTNAQRHLSVYEVS